MRKKPRVRKKSVAGLPAKGRLRDIADSLWSLAVKSDWAYKCAVCGKRGNLNSHHLVPRQHEATRYLLRNGICLCVNCHQFDVDLSPHQNAEGWRVWLKTHHRILSEWYAEHYRPPQFAGTKNVEYYLGVIRDLRQYVEADDFERIVGIGLARRLEDVDTEIAF